MSAALPGIVDKVPLQLSGYSVIDRAWCMHRAGDIEIANRSARLSRNDDRHESGLSGRIDRAGIAVLDLDALLQSGGKDHRSAGSDFGDLKARNASRNRNEGTKGSRQKSAKTVHVRVRVLVKARQSSPPRYQTLYFPTSKLIHMFKLS